jgi:hypothetical protein
MASPGGQSVPPPLTPPKRGGVNFFQLLHAWPQKARGLLQGAQYLLVTVQNSTWEDDKSSL